MDAIDPLRVVTNRQIMITGTRPKDLLNHMAAKIYVILGMTPTEFKEIHGGDVFDFLALCELFKKYCKDFGEDLKVDTISKAVQFCSLILYTVGPESRTVKKNMSHKVWEFRFPYNINKAFECKCVFVSTYKNANVAYKPEETTNGLTLSIKHASLLAMVTMGKITDIVSRGADPVYMLTPLCGAIFSRLDILEIAKKLKMPA